MGGGEIIYLSLHCHHQNDSCIEMGSDESNFNVSVGSDGKSHKDSVHKPQPFRREMRAEAVSNRGPSAYQPNALPLGQAGSVTAEKALTTIILLPVTRTRGQGWGWGWDGVGWGGVGWGERRRTRPGPGAVFHTAGGMTRIGR